MKNEILRYLFITGIGRREIGPRDPLLAAVTKALKQLADSVPDAQPVAMSSAAAGADQVFLEAAQALGWPLRLVLPAPVHVFEKDFERRLADGALVRDEAGLAAFRKFASAAIDVEVLPAAPGRRDAFARTADELVRRADVVVALWDGLPGKIAGASETLVLAQSLKRQVALLDSTMKLPQAELSMPDAAAVAAVVEKRHATGILRDIAEAIAKAPVEGGRSALQRLQEAGKNGGHSESTGKKPKTLDQVLEDVLKEGARSLSDQHRKNNALALALHVLAMAVGLIGLAFFGGETALGTPKHTVVDLIAALKLGLVVYAVWVIWSLHRRHRQLRWSRARYVREIGRSLSRTAGATARLGEAVGAFVPPSLWALFRRLTLSLTTLYAEERSKRPRPSLAATMKEYRRLIFDLNAPESQGTYFFRRGNDAKEKLRKLRKMVWWCLSLMVASAALALALAHFGADPVAVKMAKFLSVFLPVLAASLLVLPNLNDWNRRATVYTSIAKQLAALDLQLVTLQTQLATPGSVAVRRPKLAGETGGDDLNVAVWSEEVLGKLEEEDYEEKRAHAVEAMVANRFAAIVAEAERAILTELVGFKTFVESVELA